MKRFVAFSLIVLCAILASAATRAADVKVRDIQKPLFSAPAFTLPGGSVDVILKTGEAGALKAASLKTLNGDTAATIALSDALKAGDNALTLSLPGTVGIGLYDLCLDFTDGGADKQDCQPHAVAVAASMDPPFTFAQITDYHMGDPRALEQFPGIDIAKVRVTALETANKYDPAFVLFTGDICAYPETYEQDYPAAVAEILGHITVPTLMIPGNHDLYAKTDMDGKLETEGLDYWHEFFGPTHQALDFGPFRFIGFDTYGWPQSVRNRNRPYHAQLGTMHTFQGAITQEEMSWVIEQLKTLDGRTPILFAHHGPRTFEVMPQQFGCSDCISQTKMMKFVEKSKAPYYIYGHIHRNEDVTENGTEFIATTSTGSDVSMDDLWAIRLYHVNKDLTITSEIIRLFDTPPMK